MLFRYYAYFNTDEALPMSSAAIRLHLTHQWYALLLVESGRFSEAIAEARRDQLLDPSSSIRENVAIVLHLAGRYDTAMSEARSILELELGCLRARLALRNPSVSR